MYEYEVRTWHGWYRHITLSMLALAFVSAHKLLKKAITKAGLSKDISWHWFRHSCASHSLKNGASLESVRRKLGHSSISITNTYIHDDEDASLFLDI